MDPLDRFDITDLRNSNINFLFAQRGLVDMSPAYQRQGGVWTQEKRQLLIDSIINQFDVPKFYLHEFSPPKKLGDRRIKYAIVDGKQRMEAVWDFKENRYPLSDDFVYLHDSSVEAAGLTYTELRDKYPELAVYFDSCHLSVVVIHTNDIELIEEMFSRLNEAVPLNAPEKRNGLGGLMPAKIRDLVGHPFFAGKVPFTDRRYRHRDLATKFMYLADAPDEKVRDTKKIDLDRFFLRFKQSSQHWPVDASLEDRTEELEALEEETRRILDAMSAVFSDRDPLLAQIGTTTVYFLLFRDALRRELALPERSKLAEFQRRVSEVRPKSEAQLSQGDLELMEFGYRAQSPNDGSALEFRLRVLKKHIYEAA